MKFFAAISVCVFAAVGALSCGGSGEDAGSQAGGVTIANGTLHVQGQPPRKLIVRDLIKGSGVVPIKGGEVSVQNLHFEYKRGEEVQLDWSQAEEFSYRFAAGEVLPAWDRGMKGMRVGGRRELIVPAKLAYGNVPTIYLIDLLTAKPTLRGPEPDIHVPAGAPPKSLVVRNLRPGRGAGVQSGDEVTIQYVGAGFKTGKPFDTSWERGVPHSFQVGSGNVLPGWERGVQGMKVGGRRELIIPPDLTLGEVDTNETLIYVIDLLAIGGPSDTPPG
jgi:peptidylprolyl isomerase